MTSRTLVIATPVREAATTIMDGISAACLALGEETDIVLGYEGTEEDDDGTLQVHVYLDEENDVRVYETVDHRNQVAFVTVEAGDEHVDVIVEAIRRALPVAAYAELEERAAATAAADPSALVRMALAADHDSPAPRGVELIRAGLAAPQPARHRAIEAASLSRWHVLRPDLEAVTARDPDPGTRDYARTARDLIDTHAG